MNNHQNFINSNLEFLQKANIDITTINYSTFSIDSEKRISVHMKITDSLSCISIENVPHLKFISIFAIFDYYIDSIFPELLGKNYSYKYNHLILNQSSPIDQILSEIYRISFFIRNCITHRPNEFIVESTQISATGKFPPQEIKITPLGLSILFGLINLNISHDFKESEYKSCLIFNLYNNLKTQIITFNDQYGTLSAEISSNINLHENRNIILNPEYIFNERKIIFQNLPNREDYNAVDIPTVYYGKKYLLPREALDNENSINVDEMTNKWEYQHNHPILNTLFSNTETHT